MNDQGELSVASIADFKNASNFVVMHDETCQKFVIVNDKVNNEVIKDFYEENEFTKPKILKYENEKIALIIDDRLKENSDLEEVHQLKESNGINEISNEPDGKEVSISVTLKLKNDNGSVTLKKNDENNETIIHSMSAMEHFIIQNTNVLVKTTPINCVNKEAYQSLLSAIANEIPVNPGYLEMIEKPTNLNTGISKEENNVEPAVSSEDGVIVTPDNLKPNIVEAKEANTTDNFKKETRNSASVVKESNFSVNTENKNTTADIGKETNIAVKLQQEIKIVTDAKNETAILAILENVRPSNIESDRKGMENLVSKQANEISSRTENAENNKMMLNFAAVMAKYITDNSLRCIAERSPHVKGTQTKSVEDNVSLVINNAGDSVDTATKSTIQEATENHSERNMSAVIENSITGASDGIRQNKNDSGCLNDAVEGSTNEVDKFKTSSPTCQEEKVEINLSSEQQLNPTKASHLPSNEEVMVIKTPSKVIAIFHPETASGTEKIVLGNANTPSLSPANLEIIEATLSSDASGNKTEESTPQLNDHSKTEPHVSLIKRESDNQDQFASVAENQSNDTLIRGKIKASCIKDVTALPIIRENEESTETDQKTVSYKYINDEIKSNMTKYNNASQTMMPLYMPPSNSVTIANGNITNGIACNGNISNDSIAKESKANEHITVDSSASKANENITGNSSASKSNENITVYSSASKPKENINVDPNASKDCKIRSQEITTTKVVSGNSILLKEIIDGKFDIQVNGKIINENLMKKINETLINLFIETTNNNIEFDATSIKKAAYESFMKLYGKELSGHEERFQKQVDDLSRKLSEKQKEVKDLSEELKESKQATLKKDSSTQRYEIQIDQLKTQVREEETKAESVRIELQYARNETELTKAKMRRLEDELTKANEVADSLREQNANRSRDSNRLKELEDKVKDLEDQLKKSECTRKDLEKSLTDIENERDEELKIVQDALDEAAEERQELISSFKKELEMLNTTNTAREQQMLEDFEWKLHEMEKDYKSKLEENSKQAEEKLKTLRSRVESELSDTLTTVTEERKMADEKLMEVGHLKSYEAEVIQLRGVTHEFQKALRASAREMENLKLRERLLNDEIRGLKMGAQSRQNTLQRVKRHTDDEEVRQKMEKLRNEINAEWEDKLRKECSRLKSELDDLHSEEKHLAVESMKVQKEQEIQRLRKSWEQRQEEMANQVSSLKDNLADKDAYFHRELDNQRTMTDRDLWDLRMKLQKLNESSYDQKQQLEEKYREDIERLRVDYEDRIRELESRLAICDAQKGIDLLGQMEKDHKMQMQHVGEQHQLSMERLREELEAEKFQAVEDTRLIITNHHIDIETNLKEKLAQMQTSESQIRDELEAVRFSLQRREETVRTLEEELERCRELKGDSYSSTTSSFPPAASTTSSGFSSSQFSLASSNDSQGSRNSQDRYSYNDSGFLAEGQDDSQRNSGLLGKVFGGGWFTPSKPNNRRGSTPLSSKKPYS